MIDLNNIEIKIEQKNKGRDLLQQLCNIMLYYNAEDITYKIYIGHINVSTRKLYLVFELQYKKLISKTKIIRKYKYKCRSIFHDNTGYNYRNIPKKYRDFAKELFILFEDMVLLPEKLNQTNIKTFTIYKDLYN
jgi:hypothetical protein